MPAKLAWLCAFVGAYWAYCLYWGVTAARMAGSAAEFVLADRRLPPWVFVASATAMSFSGWMVLGHPDLVFRDGLPFAQLALGAVAIPLTGVLFLKRQWLLARRFDYVTPAEMYGHYFGGEGIRLLVLLVALVFAVPFVGMQLRASGWLLQYLSDGAVDASVAMWVLTAVVFLYVCFGGMRAAAYVGTLQGLLMVAGLAALGLLAVARIGGFGALNAALARLGTSGLGPWGVSAQGYSSYLAIPGVIQFTAGLGREDPVGGIWTASMILSYAVALMGIQAMPAFSVWGFGSRSPKAFGPQQVWASAAFMGLLLVCMPVALGLGSRFLGAAPAESAAGLAVAAVVPAPAAGAPFDLATAWLAVVGQTAPWFAALLAVCALAAVQALAAAAASATGTMYARDVYLRYIRPDADDRRQKLHARIGIGLVLLAALLVGTYAPASQAALGALALAFGAQLVPALAAICWMPWVTRAGVLLGLVAGLVVVVFTEPFGGALARFLGFELPWGRWPWTVHSAGWGLAANVAVCLVVSWISGRADERGHRQQFHAFLREAAAASSNRRHLRPVAWALTLAWLFFGLGPGAVVGNDLFGAPNGGLAAWKLGLPSLWAWQFLWWALGVLVIWFLAYKMELSTVVGRSVEFSATGRSEPAREPAAVGADWQRWFWGTAVAAALLVGAHWMFG